MYCKGGIQRSHYFDLEDPTDLARLQNPKLALEPLEGLVVIDEVQRLPDLLTVLRVLVDKYPHKKFLVLGSASGELLRQSSETLAGRIAYIELTPFSYSETKEWHNLWLRGGFPKSYLAEDEENSSLWRRFYVSTYLERDLPQFGINIPPATLRRFWTMLAHYHGNLFNAYEIGRSFGASSVTMRHYLDILAPDVYDSTASTLARKSKKEAGEGAKDLFPRKRIASLSSQYRGSFRASGSPMISTSKHSQASWKIFTRVHPLVLNL